MTDSTKSDLEDMDYWAINISADLNLDEDKIDYFVDGIQKITEMVPTRKSNLFNLIKEGQANWEPVNTLLTQMSMRARFNSSKILGPYVLTTSKDLFDNEDDFVKWFDSCPKQAFDLIKEKAEKY